VTTLDHVVRPELVVGRRAVSTFHVCGITGYGAAVALAAALASATGRSVAVIFLLAALAAVCFVGLVAARKLVTGVDRITYYHHELTVLAAAGVALAAAGRPILPYLDVSALALGAFLAFGRIGCLLAGCCHGRPAHVGVRYGWDHVDDGFESCRVGVRLFPVQAVESAYTAAVVGVGSALLLRGAAPGSALALSFVLYGAGRFGFELLRGDALRPYLAGLTEAQWTSAALAGIAVAFLPVASWERAVAALVWASAAVLVIRHVLDRSASLAASPRHLGEVWRAAEHLSIQAASGAAVSEGPANVHTTSTSHGIRISASAAAGDDGCLHHYCISAGGRPLAPRTLASVERILSALNCDSPDRRVIERNGVHHLLLFHPRPPAGTDAV
jgi:Prolipoprotein diacylglyceryl transferase